MKCTGIGYLAIETSSVDDWSVYLTDVIGLMPAVAPPGGNPEAKYFRMDERAYRFTVTPSSEEAYTPGWELPSRVAFATALEELTGAGVAIKELDRSDAMARGVSGLALFHDPFGHPMELFWGHRSSEELFRSPQGVSAFRAGALGIGHLLYVVPSCEEAVDFYTSRLSFDITDYFQFGEQSAWFLRCNPRHHTIAFVDLPLPGGLGLNHVMVEADTLRDVGRALDRAQDAKVPIVNSLGQHSNDEAISFYMGSPGRCNVEFGVDQMRIDDAQWSVLSWTGRGEYWGHRGPYMDEIADARLGDL
jgi:3,4-dihydroxy-9,10-secoandrosta-1,3,5(10)-triene-9,17-dione 4,5-dioxygenase